jgi:DNA-binding XRE family transcriptional regulator
MSASRTDRTIGTVARMRHAGALCLHVRDTAPTVSHMNTQRGQIQRPTIRLRSDNWHAACRARGLVNQTDRAVALGVDRTTIVRLESGRAAPSTDVIAAAIAAFTGALPGVKYVFAYLFTVVSR